MNTLVGFSILGVVLFLGIGFVMVLKHLEKHPQQHTQQDTH